VFNVDLHGCLLILEVCRMNTDLVTWNYGRWKKEET